MARKSIKGYAEKNYYDNTRFNGGIVATNDPLNEGYFKHLVNFDITDTGMSITPRKGFLTTTVNAATYYNDIDISFDIVYDDGDDTIFDIGFNNPEHCKYVCNHYKYYSIDTVHAFLRLTHTDVTLEYDIHYDVTISEGHIIFTANNESSAEVPTMFKTFSILELNTGIINTTLLTIQGYVIEFSMGNTIARALTYSTAIDTISNQTIYFYDESLGEYVFLDLLNSSNSAFRAWRVGFDDITNFITDCVHINNVDITDINNILNYKDSWTLRKIHPVSTLQAIRVVDENLVTSYVIKVYYEDIVEGNPTNNYLWLKLFYRKNKTTYGDTTYEGDTLVVSYLDTEDIVDFVDITQRNIASHQSVIPNPMQVIYTNDTKPDGHINQLPMVYIKNTKGDYLINSTRYIHNLSVVPNYYIVEAPDNYVWAYAYDVLSTNKDLVLIDTAAVHRSNIYNLKTNEIILEDNIDVYGKYYKKMLEYGESYNKLDSLSNKEYISYVSSLNFRINDESLYDDENTLIVYVLPKYANKNPSTGEDMYTCNIMPKTEEDSEILWMLGLHNVKIIGDVSEYLTYIQEYKNLWEEHHMWQPKYTIYRKFDTSLPSGLGKNEAIHIPKDVDELYEILSTYKDTHTFKIKPLKDVTLDLINDFDPTKGYDSIFQTALNSSIIAFKDQGLDLEELWKYIIRNTNYNRILIRPYTTVSKVEACTSDFTKHHAKYNKKDIFKLFPDSFVEDSDNTRGGIYYLYTDSQWYYNISEPTIINYEEYLEDIAVTDYPEWRTFVNYFYDVASDYNTFFKTSIEYNNDTDYYTEVSSLPILTSDVVNVIRADGVEVYSIDLKRTSHEYSSLFKYIGNELIATLDDSNETYKMLDSFNYFSEGFNIVFYLMCIPTKEYVNNNSYLSGIIDYNRETFISTYSLSNSRSIITSTDIPNVYTPVLVNDSNAIMESYNYLTFDSMLGNHLVVYKDNKVYISKEGMPHYFTQDYMKEYPEPVVKVIQYKDMLLVFTSQNLYALYLYEDVTTVTTTKSFKVCDTTCVI